MRTPLAHMSRNILRKLIRFNKLGQFLQQQKIFRPKKVLIDFQSN